MNTPKKRIVVVAVILLITFAVSTSIARSASASPVVGYSAGRIIEDSVFTNTSTMDIGQIQAFLNSKVPSCDTWGTKPSEYGGGTRAQWAIANRNVAPPYICLKDYVENGKSAAQIIAETSQEFRINPQTFIVLLQKEQGLVTDEWPLPTQYRTATGYGCPDTAACDSQYYGFTNQLRRSGIMFRSILNNNPDWYTPYILGNNFVRWSPNASCGGSTINIENRSTQALYNYTPYQPNQAALNAGYGTGDSCSAYGNRNFYLYFRDWFGYNSGPVAFRASPTSTIYIPTVGYKLAVPHAAILQDYGISLDSIQTVSQTYVDSMPSPPAETGISQSIGHIVKSPRDDDEDGGSIYLISRGKRYQIQSMQQFFSFGFSEAEISYLPLTYISSMTRGGTLSNFIASPYGSVFQVTNSTKRIYFEYNTYISQNPNDTVTPFSYYLVDRITSGTPITDRPVMVKYRDSEAVYLYSDGSYSAIPNYDIYSCWGLENPLRVPVYRVPQNNYLSPIVPTSTLSCIIESSQGKQIMNGQQRYTAGSLVEQPGINLSTSLASLASKIPLRQEPLKSYAKTHDSAAVWLLTSSSKRQLIPSYSSFIMLGLNDTSVDTISPALIKTFVPDGIKLADGQVVKSTSSPAVFVISNNERVLYASSDLFLAYGNRWSSIEAYSPSDLDAHYPYTGHSVNDFLVDKTTNKPYLIAQNGCFSLTSTMLTSLGKSLTSMTNSQTYEASVFKNLSLTCRTATPFIKRSGESLVYYVDSGQKHALLTYGALLNRNAGKEPIVMSVTGDVLLGIPSGISYSE